MHYLALGVPGHALPGDLLTNCGLPTVDDMVFDSRHGERLFKDQRDHTFVGPPAGLQPWILLPIGIASQGMQSHASVACRSTSGTHFLLGTSMPQDCDDCFTRCSQPHLTVWVMLHA